MLAAFDPQTTAITLVPSATEPGSYNLCINGVAEILCESYAVVDQVREALYGHRAGVAGECLELADAILQRFR